MRLLALRYWRAEGSKTLAKLRRRLDSITFPEMEAWVMSHPLPADTAAALRGAAAGVRGESGAPSTRPGAASSAIDSADALLQLPSERWQRWTLMPGLELHVESDAAPITRQLAARLCRAFASFVSPPAE